MTKIAWAVFCLQALVSSGMIWSVVLNLFPSINGYFSDERRSPRVSALDVLKYASAENPCAALLIEKTSHL